MDTRTSIAILGAGISGLTLAATLVENGFRNIVIFERDAEVGGKSCTVEIDGRAHDLGATMGVPLDYDNVLAFSRAGGIATSPFPREQHFSLTRGGPVPLNRRREMPRVMFEAAKYIGLHATWRGVDGSGLHRADPALYAPWNDTVERHGLHAVSRRLLCYRAGYGYGFDDEVPAVMYANLLRPKTFLGLAVDNALVWTGGTQPIWTSLARRLEQHVEIRRGTPVTRISRDLGGVTVYSKHGAERFDELAITIDPAAALQVLDASDQERAWFSQVRTYPYSTVAADVSGLEAGRTSVGYIDENMCRERAGHPTAWVKRYADRDIYVFHLLAPDALPDAELARRIGEDVARLGGRLEAVRAVRRWRFFPHFTSAAMQSGVLTKIDRWQGQHRAHLVGEALSFATMARVAENARNHALRMIAATTRVSVAMRSAS
ncbi:MAG TPA: FAD-dependent oxidoreductase [Kofleriaceae bacterium]